MKKISIFFLILLFSMNLFAQNPNDIVNKCVNALGGEEALKKYSSYHAKGEVMVSMYGMELPGTLETIEMGRKKWSRLKIAFRREIYTMIMSYDGKTAWMDRMGTIVDQPSLNYESDLDHHTSLLIEKGAVFSFVKEKEIEGRKTFGIEVDFKSKKTAFFIDQETYTVLEVIYNDLYYGEKFTKEKMEKRVSFRDYKKFDGVLFPTRMTVYREGKKYLELHYREVSFNPKVALAKFKRLDQKLDLRYGEEIIH